MHEQKKKYNQILNCRLCNNSELENFIDFGSVALGNNLQRSVTKSKNIDTFDLSIVRCSACNHFQLSVSVSPEILYATNYTYLSGIGSSFVKHLKRYVDWVIYKTSLNSQSVVVDIGSNDGTCLNFFKKKGFLVCGVDPAQKPSKIANDNGIFTINKFFDSDIAEMIISKFGQVDLVTSQNALAHVNDLIMTFKNIHKILKFGGYFVFEVGYFKKVLETKCFDTIYHEHIDYHHASPLVKILNEIGFDINHISENNIQGGSVRLLLQKKKKAVISSQAQNFLDKEKKSILYDKFKLGNWADQIKKSMTEFNNLVVNHISEEKICYAYGAPTKATLLFKTSKLNENQISFIIEDNKLKTGKFLPMTSIPIKYSKEINFNAEAIIIVFAWNFAEDIIDKLKNTYRVPATIIVPLPKPRVIKIC